MVKNITDSIKAKLYDFAYTPFMSSFVISWILLNHKYLLIYFGNEKLEKKLNLLNGYPAETIALLGHDLLTNQFIYPLTIALIYVFIYPWFALKFYDITLYYNKESKKIKQKKEDQTPVTQEEANKIREEIEKLLKERDIYNKDQIEMRENFKSKIFGFEENIRTYQLAKNEYDKDISEKEQKINKLLEIEQIYETELGKKQNYINELENKINKILAENAKEMAKVVEKNNDLLERLKQWEHKEKRSIDKLLTYHDLEKTNGAKLNIGDEFKGLGKIGDSLKPALKLSNPFEPLGNSKND